MEDLSGEGRVVYHLLRHEISTDFDLKLKAQEESILESMSRMLEANNSTLVGLMSARADTIRDEVMLDLEQIKADMNKLEAVDPGPKQDGGSSSRNVGQGRGGATTDAISYDYEHRRKAHNIYVPPPARGARK
ncbi:hypothetical protein D1007_19941 [Hordeum vulgare]|nr:hypothetical protein D1007_19941 [Hordeum vulgare]